MPAAPPQFANVALVGNDRDARVVESMHILAVHLHARGRKMLVGVGEGPDHRTALDRAEEKLRPQLLKAGRVRQRTRRAPTRDA